MRAQSEAIQIAIKTYDESRQKELATEGDVQEVRLEIEKVRANLINGRSALPCDHSGCYDQRLHLA